MIRQIQQNEFSEAINRDITTIVKFEADWCGPCKAIMPSVEKISDEWSDKETNHWDNIKKEHSEEFINTLYSECTHYR